MFGGIPNSTNAYIYKGCKMSKREDTVINMPTARVKVKAFPMQVTIFRKVVSHSLKCILIALALTIISVTVPHWIQYREYWLDAQILQANAWGLICSTIVSLTTFFFGLFCASKYIKETPINGELPTTS